MGLTTKEISSSSFNDMISSVDRRSEYVENRSGANVRLNNFLTPYTLDDKSSILNAPCGYSNGVYASLRPVQTFGPELITNGDFSNGLSNWSYFNASLVDGGVNLNNIGLGGQNTYIKQNDGYVIGNTYKLELDVINTNGADLVIENASNTSIGTQTIGRKIVYFTQVTTNEIAIKRLTGDTNVVIDNLSVKEVIDADFDFTRGSAATRVNSQGLVENVQILSGELVTNGGFDTDSDWTLQSAWTISSGKAIYDNSANNSCSQSFNFQVGKKYQVNFEISDFTTDYRFDVYTGVSFIQSAIITSETSFSILFDGDGGNLLRFRGLARGTGFSLDNVSVKEVTDDTNLPRIDYTNGTGSLLLEPQSTNLILNSNDLTKNTWSRLNSTASNSNVINPEGISGASLYVCNNYTGNNQFFRRSSHYTYDNDVVYTYSMFVKYNSFQFCKLSYINYNPSEYFTAVFDIINETVTATSSDGTPQNTSANIQDFGNGWFRISISAAITSSSGNPMNFEFNKSPSGTPTFGIYGRIDQTTTTNDKIYVYGAQLEQKSYATSYIPTSGSTVTRNADVCNNAGSSDLINSTEGCLYLEASFVDDTSFKGISISNGTNTNTIRIYHSPTDNQLVFRVTLNSVDQFLETYILNYTSLYNKICLNYKENDFSVFINGFKVLEDTSGSTFASGVLNQLNLNRGDGQDPFIGNIRSVAVFKEALTDEELAKITSTTQQEAFYEMRDKMLQINADYYEFGDYTTRLKKLF